MADRQGTPTHDPIDDLLRRIQAIEDRLESTTAAIERLNIQPLQLVVTMISGGPPPTFSVELVNPATGNRVTLAAAL